MAILRHIVGHPLSWIWLCANLLGESHPAPFLLKAAGKLSLRWLGQGGRGAWVGKQTGLGGGGTNGSMPHNSTQGQSDQRPAVYWLVCPEHYQLIYLLRCRGGHTQLFFESTIAIPQLEGSTSTIAIPQLFKKCCSAIAFFSEVCNFKSAS